MQHMDAGKFGSEFTIVQPPLQNFWLLIFMFMAISIAAFSFGLHLIDVQILLFLCIFLLVVSILRFSQKVYSESLLILPSLGLQVKTLYYLGTVNTNFIHISHIQDIVINEAVTMHSILHYLVVLLCDTDTKNDMKGLYPLFSHSWPPLSNLKDVYRAAQEKLIKPNRR